jgi:predicted nuclease of predicted toxin-antitoxin system
MPAVTVWDAGLNGRSDETVFAYAWKHRRILLTHDDDFWNDRRFPEHRNPGVVILPGANGDQRDMIRGLLWMMLMMRRDPKIWLKSKVRVTRDDNVYTELPSIQILKPLILREKSSCALGNVAM